MEDLNWKKSSYSGVHSDCVEVAKSRDGGVYLRDTKDRSLPAHLFTASEWAAFIKGVKDGEFD